MTVATFDLADPMTRKSVDSQATFFDILLNREWKSGPEFMLDMIQRAFASPVPDYRAANVAMAQPDQHFEEVTERFAKIHDEQPVQVGRVRSFLQRLSFIPRSWKGRHDLSNLSRTGQLRLPS